MACASALWVAQAQERPGVSPPPVLPPVAPTKYPKDSSPSAKKGKAADPKLIVPPEVYEVPRPITPPIEIQVEKLVPASAETPAPVAPTTKENSIPAPTLGPDVKTENVIPATITVPPALPPMPAPMKDEFGVSPAAPLEPKPEKGPLEGMPLPPPTLPSPMREDVVPAPKPAAPMALDPLAAPPLPATMPEPTKLRIAPPPELEPVQKDPVRPTPPAPVMPIETGTPGPAPAPVLPVPAPAPTLPPPTPLEKKAELPATPAVVPPAKTVEPKVVSVVTPVGEPATRDSMKWFLPIRPDTTRKAPAPVSNVSPAPVPPPVGIPPLRVAPPGPVPQALNPQPLKPQPTAPIVNPASNLEPSAGIVVEKRGPDSLRAGETQLFQIVVRNTSLSPAQQVRIEDEIPAEVRILAADPMPATVQGGRAGWVLPIVPAGSEQTLKLTLKADANVTLARNPRVNPAALNVMTRANSAPNGVAVRVIAPARLVVGQSATFDIHVTNQTSQPLTNLVLHGELPPELMMPMRDQSGVMREERKIEGPIEGMTIAPGDFKILKMPTTAVRAGRAMVFAKVASNQGESLATAEVEVGQDAILLHQGATTRLALGRLGDLRIDLVNQTGKPLKNLTIANLLPEGLSFVAASDRGLFQSNSRTVHWYLDSLPVGATKTLLIRVQGHKEGQFANYVSAKADGMSEVRSTGTIILEGSADLSLRVRDRDNPLEVGRETVYEIVVQNPGTAPTKNVQVQVQFPPGLVPKNAQGISKFALDRQSVVFEPIPTLDPQGQAIYRVSAVAQSPGLDQRVRFSVVSDEIRTPLHREISTVVP